jgi:hypothetical protein
MRQRKGEADAQAQIAGRRMRGWLGYKGGLSLAHYEMTEISV